MSFYICALAQEGNATKPPLPLIPNPPLYFIGNEP